MTDYTANHAPEKSDVSLAGWKLLSIIERLTGSTPTVTREKVIYLLERKVIIEDWEQTAGELVNRGILLRAVSDNGEEVYSISPEHGWVREHIRSNNLLNKFFYNDFYERAELSKAHARFCELAYGRNFCQHGVADMQQIDELVTLLKKQNARFILDIGCGDGYITEYIAEETGAQVLGVDIADDAIERAQKRVQHSTTDIRFAVMDIQKMEIAPESFDAILSIDSLYFVGDLHDLVKSLNSLLKPQGMMYLYFLVPPKNMAGEPMSVENCRLSAALANAGYSYHLIDLTEANRAHWKNKEEVLQELKADFAEEGNLFLYRNRMEECLAGVGEFQRYLFVVEGKKA